MNDIGGAIGCLVWAIVMFVGWANHLYVCFTEQAWGFLVAGAIFFPIGIVHGWGRIFGWW